MCDNVTIRTEIRDATLAATSPRIDDADLLDAVEWASERTVDRCALGTAADCDLGDFYAGTAFRGSAL